MLWGNRLYYCDAYYLKYTNLLIDSIDMNNSERYLVLIIYHVIYNIKQNYNF